MGGNLSNGGPVEEQLAALVLSDLDPQGSQTEHKPKSATLQSIMETYHRNHIHIYLKVIGKLEQRKWILSTKTHIKI